MNKKSVSAVAAFLALILSMPLFGAADAYYSIGGPRKNVAGTTGATGATGPSGPTGATYWDAGTNGLYYNGDGVIVGPDAAWCKVDGGPGDLHVEDDMEIKGGALWYCADQGIFANTADGSDSLTLDLGGGGAIGAGGSRGAAMRLQGNEANGGAPGGGFLLYSGNDAGAVGNIKAWGSGGSLLLEKENGATDTSLTIAETYVAVAGAANTLFWLNVGVDMLLEGDTADAFETTFGAAPGLAADTVFRTPPTTGSTSNVLVNKDGSGETYWAARPTSVTLSNRDLTCTNCGAGTAELMDNGGLAPATRTSFDTTGYSQARVLLVLSAAAVTADLVIQCDTDSAFGSATAVVQEDNPTRNVFIKGNWASLSGECVGADVYLRAVTKNGDGSEDPAFEKIEVQFK